MNIKGIALPALGILFGLVAVFSAQVTPKVTLSAVRIPDRGHVMVRGTGFTPRHNVSSHLRKPDGTEYPVIPILADDRGEFSHDIDTLLLEVGTHELWVVDDATKVSSSPVRFEVTTDRPK